MAKELFCQRCQKMLPHRRVRKATYSQGGACLLLLVGIVGGLASLAFFWPGLLIAGPVFLWGLWNGAHSHSVWRCPRCKAES